MTDENNSITRLEEALGRLGAEHEPPKGWEDRVLGVLDKTEIDRSEPAATQSSDVLPWPGTTVPASVEAYAVAPPAPAEHPPEAGDAVVAIGTPADRRRRWLAVAAVDALGMAAAGACIVLGLGPGLRPSGPAPLELTANVESVGPLLRAGSGSAHVGDIVHASAAGGTGQRAIWVYHDERLVLSCPGAPDCRDAGGATTVDVVLRAPGTWVILAVTSAAALPVPHGSYDGDAGRAAEARATTKTARIEAR